MHKPTCYNLLALPMKINV